MFHLEVYYYYQRLHQHKIITNTNCSFCVSYVTERKYFTSGLIKFLQGDHFPDNVKFPDGSWHSSAALGMLSVTHIMPVPVLVSVVGVGMQQ